MTNYPKPLRLEEQVGDKSISFETGAIAKQAGGAVIIRIGDTVVLSTAQQANKPKDTPPAFVPLSCDYKERTYAAGKIPGGFFKREGKAREKEVLASRLTDRAVRPLFPDYFNTETQVVNMVMSFDGVNDADVIAINSASAALMISDIPWNGPVAALRMGKIDGKFIMNPTNEQRAVSEMEMVICGTLQGILMVEGGGHELPSSDLIGALETAKPELEKLCKLQIKMKEQVGKVKTPIATPEIKPELKAAVEAMARPEIEKILSSKPEKHAMERALDAVTANAVKEMTAKYPADLTASYQTKTVVEDVKYEVWRRITLSTMIRTDGRKTDEIREINIDPGFLPRTHGSAVFTRGQTQALVTATLGTSDDKQMLDALEGKTFDRFMLHYNFPSYSVGEVKPDRGPGRREIGHGHLAKRALLPLLPTEEVFPYTIRLVSDILESNGSSSMATVCGGSLAMFDAGVPLKAACSGIAMGLITDGAKFAVLSDIAGLEDHFGDMDFKITGTRKGVTALQMDVKLATGIPMDIMKQAIEQANRGRNHILDIMEKVLPAPRADISEFAPRIVKLMIPRDKIGAFIGPGGKNIRGIQERTGAEIAVEDDGSVFISSCDKASLEAAKTFVEQFSMEVEVGKVYKGTVVSIVDFGAFVEVLPGKEGLLHISEIDVKRINRVEDVLKMGQVIEVKCIEENNGKYRLSRRVLLQQPGQPVQPVRK
ncbi:MAG: polyribonucleotide nucleotidyltransferase [Elusimicrobia bacterium GWC2_64_44]|nr:MAG: polyribonucleotide nucleotidyltransferase [Elusimicrobia bacterium GWC2_64_44]